MKILKLFLLALSGLLFFISCDKIEAPFNENPAGNDTTKKYSRVVLLEDFTGHRCPNCSEAHIIAQDLLNLYKEKLVVVAVHAGFLAQPAGGIYTYNFTTPEGTELNNYFGLSAAGLPKGMVNRKKISGQYPLDKDAWGSEISNIINLPPDANIKITNNYNSSNRTVNIEVEAIFLNALNGEYNLVVQIIEDSIIKPQTTKTGGDVLNYVHMHTLRTTLNSTWGDSLTSAPITPMQNFIKSYANIPLGTDWKEKDCYVVAFIYRKDNSEGNQYEIIQAAQKKLK